ncbi:hypothetical protein LHFGNBLO_006575 (plasmid) [Mesorhizobium sp. AR10]|uniref:hypothetical protein n=1 Tax=Mesorhizobium sp. AR10 TaxID=2865839 RepID=UPI002160186D|nr:hypothetical protein [Mesorhizobium sp. AR10]UVK36055.1 hypothetical protein LHFGNBLO_006575 [Mesorhizobium sp. AR10]
MRPWTRLAGRRYVGGDYSIADIAIWPSVSRIERHVTALADFANVRRWYLELADRPAVQRGHSVPRVTGDASRPA